MPRLRIWLGLFGLGMMAGQSAEAQLFPNLWIRRQRPDPSTESPIIKTHRDHYYGLHPTEWNRFPSGWGLTNPEAINREELMQQVMKEVKELDEEFGPGDKNRDRERGGDEDLPPRGGAGAGAGRGRDDAPGNAVPRPVPLPSDTDSPFNLDDKPAAKPGAAVKPDLDTKPRTPPELPKAGDSPFDLPADKPAAKPAEDGLPPRPRTGTGTGAGSAAQPAPRTGFVNDLDISDVAAVEAPPEVMRAPERNPIRDTLSSLNPRSWVRRR